MLTPQAPLCIFCAGVRLVGAASLWVCPQCDWRMPVAGLCPRCLGELGEPDVDECRRCTTCGTEVWPPRQEYLTPGRDREARDAWLDEIRYKKSISKPGSTKPAGRKRLRPKPKPLEPPNNI